MSAHEFYVEARYGSGGIGFWVRDEPGLTPWEEQIRRLAVLLPYTAVWAVDTTKERHR